AWSWSIIVPGCWECGGGGAIGWPDCGLSLAARFVEAAVRHGACCMMIAGSASRFSTAMRRARMPRTPDAGSLVLLIVPVKEVGWQQIEIVQHRKGDVDHSRAQQCVSDCRCAGFRQVGQIKALHGCPHHVLGKDSTLFVPLRQKALQSAGQTENTIPFDPVGHSQSGR
ncbi:MAG: hypothetical protein ABWY49_05285, partial [Rhizobium sp.]